MFTNSSLITMFRRSRDYCIQTDKYVAGIYKESLLFRLYLSARDQIVPSFSKCLLSRAAEGYVFNYARLVSQSGISRIYFGFFSRCVGTAKTVFKNSRLVGLAASCFRGKPHVFLLNSAGVALIAAVIANLTLVFIFDPDLGSFHLAASLLLLFLGCALLYSKASWPGIKKGSFFINLINNYCKR